MPSNELDEEVIFGTARKIQSAEARAEYLEQVCEGDPALRERVDVLLAALEAESEFLESPMFAPTVDAPAVTEQPGSHVGRYKLLQRIGEGGFGVVYMAEQTKPVRRKVALKIIKPGMDTREVVARFEAERQALAMMDHPNIAKVLDGGETDSGRPYFVMELVKGIPITKFCDDQKLTTRERLELFITICSAIQHAHQKAIIHRDIKPSNVLVTLHDGTPVPKVIDFGISKAINQQLTEKTLFTSYGQMVGTPQYMSPEQAELSGLDVDTRSDIYSLGVLLYELLTGTTPLESERMRTAGFVEMQRMIKEEDAAKPSTRVSGASERVTEIARQRGLTPDALRRTLRGDLDWVVMKSLEKDRNRRYETANGLSRDIERYLRSEPVTAAKPTATYRLRKFAMRNRGLVTSIAGILMSLLMGTAVAITLYLAARNAERNATLHAEQAEEARVQAVAQRELAESRAVELAQSNQTNRQLLYVADLTLAFDAFNQGNLSRAKELLERQRAGDERNSTFAWNVLNRVISRGTDVTLYEHGEPILALAMSRDRQLMATAGMSGSVVLWNVEQGTRMATLKAERLVQDATERNHRFHISVSFSHDGSLVAAAQADRPMSIWRVDSGQQLEGIEEFKALQVAFANTRDELAIVTEEAVYLYDLLAGTKRRVAGRDGTVFCPALRYSPDDAYLAWVSERFLYCYDTVNDVLKKIPPPDSNQWGWLFAIDFARDQPWIAVSRSRSPHRIEIYSLATGKVVAMLQHHRIHVFAITFSEDDQRLFAGDARGNVHVWRTNDWQLESSSNRHGSGIDGIALASNRAWGLTVGTDGLACKWSVTQDRLPNVLRQSPTHMAIQSVVDDERDLILNLSVPKSGRVRRFERISLVNADTAAIKHQRPSATTPKMERVAGKCNDSGLICVWDGRTHERLASIPGTEAVEAIALSYDGSRIVTFDKKEVTLTSLATGTTTRHSLEGVERAWFDQSGALYCSISGAIQKWSPDPFHLQQTFDLNIRQSHLEVSPNGRIVHLSASPVQRGGTRQPGSEFFDLQAGRVLLRSVAAKTNSPRRSTAYSPNGRLVALKDRNEIRLVDVSLGREVGLLSGHLGPVNALEFGPDGKTLVSGGGDGLVKLWDVDTRQEIATILADEGNISSIGIGAEGTLIAANSNEKLFVWPRAERRESAKNAGTGFTRWLRMIRLRGVVTRSVLDDESKMKTVVNTPLGRAAEFITKAEATVGVERAALLDEALRILAKELRDALSLVGVSESQVRARLLQSTSADSVAPQSDVCI